jgi:hypothetical protein
MRNLLPLSLAVLLWVGALPVAAKEAPEHLQTIAKMAPELRHLDFVWAEAQGDLNGDGIPDAAILLTGSKGGSAHREERLVVVAGISGGGYRVLSVSGEFCHPSKFYQLDIREHDLFVEAVETADAARHASATLQFRYNAKLKDLELIGEELRSVAYDEDAEERTSSNYLSGRVVQTSSSRGKTKTKAKRIANPARPKLAGWACRN